MVLSSAMSERKFTRALHKPGMAAQLRETVSQVIRESAVLNKPLVVEPIDFEEFVTKNKTLMQNDPHRELLIYQSEVYIIANPNLRTNYKSFTDIFAAPNEAIICTTNGVKGQTFNTSASSTTTSSASTAFSSSSNTTPSSLNINSNNVCSANNQLRKNSSTTKSPTPSSESYDLTNSSRVRRSSNTSSTTTTTNTNASILITGNRSLAQSEDIPDNSSQLCFLDFKSMCSRFTRQALHTYRCTNYTIHYKYSDYGGTCHDLPKLKNADVLQEEIYEIDADQDRIDEQMSRSQADSITKQGYLLKGPDSSTDRMFANIGNKSFKRRYCYLRQEVDGTYILELHKDEKQREAKATIVMDFCTDVVQNPKRSRYCFELRMTAGHKSFTLAAENEEDLKGWLSKLTLVLQQNKLQEDKRVSSLERTATPQQQSSAAQLTTTSTSSSSSSSASINQQLQQHQQPQHSIGFGTLKGLEQSMNPQLIKYGRETDVSIAQARRENRRRLFGNYQSMVPRQNHSLHSILNNVQENIEPYREHFGKRFFIKCQHLKFRLQFPREIMSDGGGASAINGGDLSSAEGSNQGQFEPYITSLALYDIRAGRKITETFYFNINEDHIRPMMQTTPVPQSVVDHKVPKRDVHDGGGGAGSTSGSSQQHDHSSCAKYTIFEQISKELLEDCVREEYSQIKQAIFSVTAPHPDIFIVLKIEKILQGNIVQGVEPYLKAGRIDMKMLQKLQKGIKNYTQNLGHYRQPFAWAAKPLFKLYTNELDTDEQDVFELGSLYRQEMNRLKDEELIKILADYRKLEKWNKLTVIPGSFQMCIEQVSNVNGTLTKSLMPTRSCVFPLKCPIVEITEFQSRCERDTYPFMNFCNNLFVYPLHLQYDGQRTFSRARNITVVIEVRDSDAEDATPLKCIYGRPGQEFLVTQMACPVLHHVTTPSWYEEIKIRLPLAIFPEHHLLFTFYHVSCNFGKKRDTCTSFETPIGYAWCPLLQKGKINLDEQVLRVAANLPVGYLAVQPLGLGRGNSGPEIQWIDNQRPLYAVAFRMDSTVHTSDQHLHNLFVHSERLLEGGLTSAMPAEIETCKILKASHAIDITTLINFLPTILNELFTLLVHTHSEEVGMNIIRLLINIIHMITEEAGRKELLSSYVKYVFYAPYFSQKSNRIVHSELCKLLPVILNPSNTDFLIVNKFMRYSSIFFDLILKSMEQYLLHTKRIIMLRNERFNLDYHTKVEHLIKSLIPYLFARYKDLAMETQQLNRSISQFIRKCLSLMDRGFVFQLIRYYMAQFTPGDPRILQEFKLSFLQEICQHEQYVPLNLPFVLNPKNRPPEMMMQHFNLTEDFCRQHFISGLLLQELKSSLNEVHHVRRYALSIFKQLLAKHELDDRYQNRGQLSRIALLYVPWLNIVMDNLQRIDDLSEISTPNGHVYADSASYTQRLSCSSSYVFGKDNSLTSTLSRTIVTQAQREHYQQNHGQDNSVSATSPCRISMHLKESHYLAAIAGSAITNGNSETSLNSLISDSQDTSTLSPLHHNGTASTINGNNNSTSNDISGVGGEVHLRNGVGGHNRSISVLNGSNLHPQHHPHPHPHHRYDKFSIVETKDLLIGFLFIIKHLSNEQLFGWWQNCNEAEIMNFMSVLELSLIYFRYVGRKNLSINGLDCDDPDRKDARTARMTKASTLPARTTFPILENGNGGGGGGVGDGVNFANSGTHETGTLNLSSTNRENLLEETTRNYRALYESNLSTEIGMIILDTLGLYSVKFRSKLTDNIVLSKLARIYLKFLQLGQSERLSRHVFAALRAFINNFSPALFKGNAILCGQMVYELLKACDNRLVQIRHESCAVLYLLMRSNFEFSGRKGLTRVHLQMIISVSQMIGNVIGLNNARFQESLSLINSYANSDKAMKGTGFPLEVKDLTRRVRTVLMATAQMQAHHMDPERLLELQYSLANSYASTPELRHTWLITMARNHEQNGNISEAACCHLHIAALMSEYLRLRGGCSINWGSSAFTRISRNIPRDEQGLKFDAGSQDSQYTEQMLLEQLKQCAIFLDNAERFECLGELYKLIQPIHEKTRNYNDLQISYEHLAKAYGKVIEVNRSGKRLLGRFYRVVFYGMLYFEEDHAVEYVYKEPKLTSLSEISERLAKQYEEKFGPDIVKLIMDSSPVDVNSLDPKLAYIQLTHVIPFFTKDELDQRLNEFEQNHDVDTFMYETPFTKAGSAHGTVEKQWKRKTIIKTSYSFPYVLKRIPVATREIIELSPIEVAIDEMQTKVSELEEVILPPADVKKLQLRLQGSIAVTVNAGPLAYAKAFLDPQLVDNFAIDRVEDLKDVFRDFISVCHTALQLNARMISNDQKEYHNALKDNYQRLCQALSDLLDESFLPLEEASTPNAASNQHRNSVALFNAISGASNNSNIALEFI